MLIKSKKTISAFFLALTLLGIFAPFGYNLQSSLINTTYANTTAASVPEAIAKVEKMKDQAFAFQETAEGNWNAAIQKWKDCGTLWNLAGRCKKEKEEAIRTEVRYNQAKKDTETIYKLLEKLKQPGVDLQYANDTLAQIENGPLKTAKDAAEGKIQQGNISKEATPSGLCEISLTNFDLFVCSQYLVAIIAYYAAVLASWFLGFCGLFFDAVLRYTIVDMKDNIDGTIGEAVNAAWATIRDFGNLIFIFILLWIAIQTILDYNSANTKRMVRNLIIVGLLVNFSLFFTKVAIDASNIFSITIYRNVAGLTNTNTYASVETFSGKFMQPLGLMQIWNGKDFNNTVGGDYSRMIIIGLGATIFALLTGFTFLYAGILFMIRFVLLIFLMILAPLAFFSSILPQTEKYKNQWLETLTGQLLFAPLYMVLIYAVMLLTQNLDVAGTGCNANIVSGLIPGNNGCSPTGSMAAIIKFVLIIFFMNTATVLATKQAQKGGGIAAKSVNWVNKRFTPRAYTQAAVRYTGKGAAVMASSATGGTIGFIGRRTLGQRAHNFLNSDAGKDLQKKATDGDTVAKARVEKLQRRAASSYRPTELAANAKTWAGEKKKEFKTWVERLGGKGGYKAKMDRLEQKIDQDITAAGKIDPATQGEIDAARAAMNDLQRQYQNAAAADNKTEMDRINSLIRAQEGEVAKAERKGAADIRNSQRQAAAQIASDNSSTANRRFTVYRSVGKAKARLKVAARKVEEARKRKPQPEEAAAELDDKLAYLAIHDPAKIPDTVRDAKADVVKNLSNETLIAYADHLTPDHLRALSKVEGKFKPSEKEKIYNTLVTRKNNGDTKIDKYLDDKNAKNFWEA